MDCPAYCVDGLNPALRCKDNFLSPSNTRVSASGFGAGSGNRLRLARSWRSLVNSISRQRGSSHAFALAIVGRKSHSPGNPSTGSTAPATRCSGYRENN